MPMQARNAESVRLIGEARSARMNDSAIPKARRETIIWGVYSGFTAESYKVQSCAQSKPVRIETRIQMGNHEFEAGGLNVTTLVMFSGGLDSTAVLARLLAETDQELRVHHIRMVNREARAEAEQRAVEAIVAACRERYRPFRYSESGLDFSGLEAIPIDYLAVAYVACQVAIDTPGCNRIAVGTLARDLDEIKRSVCANQRRVFSAMYECYRARKLGDPAMEWIYPVYALTKPQIAALLPPEIRSLTWSCRRPVHGSSGFRPCGVCKPCRGRIDIAGALGIAA